MLVLVRAGALLTRGGRVRIKAAATAGPIAKVDDTSARLKPWANIKPASAGPIALATRPTPITSPTPDARDKGGKLRVRMA